MPDHLHIFFGMRPSQSLSDLMQDIKEDLQNGSMTGNLQKDVLNGRRDMEHSRIVNHKEAQ